jgi:hypothetical protein
MCAVGLGWACQFRFGRPSFERSSAMSRKPWIETRWFFPDHDGEHGSTEGQTAENVDVSAERSLWQRAKRWVLTFLPERWVECIRRSKPWHGRADKLTSTSCQPGWDGEGSDSH